MKLTNAQITERRTVDQPDAREIQTYRAYAGGDHREVLTQQQQKLLGQRSEHPMVDNVIDLILKTTASRLKLIRWDVLGETPRDIATGAAIGEASVQAVTEWLASLWLMNRLPRLQFETHYAQLRDTSSVVSMAYRAGRVHLWREPWWDGETGVYVAYDDAGDYEFAVKEWRQREVDGDVITRRTVYEPGLITRWQQKGDGWVEYATPGEPAEVKTVRRRGDTEVPLPIPLVHFPNGTGVTDGHYGQSDIAPLLALQDDLNATQRDITATAMLTAFQRIFVAGMPAQGKLQIEPGGVFGTDKAEAKLTVIEAGDLSQLTTVHGYKRAAMSIASRTPIHTLTGEWPSGAALLRAEMPLIEKIEALADVNGPQWTMVAHRAMELANAFGVLDLDENVPITSVFAPAERIDELTDLEIKQARADLWETVARLPREAMLQSGLVDETAADQIIADREAERMSVLDALSTGAAGERDYGEGTGSV